MDDEDLLELCGVCVEDMSKAWGADPGLGAEGGEVERGSGCQQAHDLGSAASAPVLPPLPPPVRERAVQTALASGPVEAGRSDSASPGPGPEGSPAPEADRYVDLTVTKAVPKTALAPDLAAQFWLEEWSSEECRQAITRSEVEGLDAFILDGVVTCEECDRLVETSEALGFTFWHSGDDVEAQRKFRDADTIEMFHAPIALELYRRIQGFLQDESVVRVEPESQRWERDIEGVWEASGTNDDLLFARYKPGGHFAPHTDGYSVKDLNHRSMYSMIIYLNDCSPGGGTKFYHDSAKGDLVKDASGKITAPPEASLLTVDAVKGRALVFYHNHIHEGTAPVPGTIKYIIRSDVMYQRRDPICTLPEDVEAYDLYRRAVDLAGDGREPEALPLFQRAFRMSRSLADLYGM
uniref:Fe2OG dioxygenase domain-containing protein n=1 Tax=Rhizochromulina marina TaxID=1034831 RepID=A0A7S2RJH3_9STRA|mmetsp:Transcript_17262/g.50309  ORF Transcript_17262/g.50309 Transcript_17262/m.50309 type:complete len:408 (+) Transcript_17262:84-1307(+)